MRPTIRTFAGLHKVRIQKILSELDPTAPAAVFPTTAPFSEAPPHPEEAPVQSIGSTTNELYESLFT